MAKHTSNLISPALTVAEVRAESEALFGSIGDGAIATDEFGHITRINPAALEILDLRPEEALGKWFPRVIPAFREDGTPIPLIDRPIVRMFLSGKSVTEKAYYRTKDGHLVPVDMTVSPIILNNRPVGAVEVFRDITVENEIDRMKSEFISLASHQLRTPLSTVKTYAHMLADGYMGAVDADQSQGLKTILTAADNMNELIGTLLNIARIESGSIEITTKQHDARQLAADVIKQLQLVARNKEVELLLQVPKQPVPIKTDNLIAKEILTNLISNAVKYTLRYGVVTVKVGTHRGDIVFTVEDTGIGIPAHEQNKVFSKFFRGRNVMRQETSGTGLGLYVVKGLVSTLHGKVWFRSEEHVGTVFHVSLPREPADDNRA